MIYIYDKGDSVRVEGDISQHYPYNGIITIPKNTVFLCVEDNSEMVVFKSVSNNEAIFSGLFGQIQFDGKYATRENISDLFDKTFNTIYKSGGSGGTIETDEIIQNQEIIISMLESLTEDHNRINDMIDEINNEHINCDYIENEIINQIINEEITC